MPAYPAYEQRFIKHCIAFYFCYAQASLVLMVGDYLVDHIAYGGVESNLLRLTLALPVLLAGLGNGEGVLNVIFLGACFPLT